jgi:endo-1,4-beta-xylanase
VWVDGTTARLARKLRCGGTDSYTWLENDTAVVPNTWTELSGTLEIPADCALEEAVIYFENVPVGADVYLDDVSVVPPAGSNLLTNGGFETGITGWDTWGNGTLSASTAQTHGGSQSLTSTGRSGTGGFAAYNLTSIVSVGSSYVVSAWVWVDGTTARLARKLRCAGTDSYSWLENDEAVVPNTWTQLTGTLDIPADCALEEATIYFENVPAAADVYIDDVSVIGE